MREEDIIVHRGRRRKYGGRKKVKCKNSFRSSCAAFKFPDQEFEIMNKNIKINKS
jgi:hypothetical protein